MKCTICNKTDYVVNTSKFPKQFCSYKCYENHLKQSKKSNCKCSVCNKEMYMKSSRLQRTKNGITCSKECGIKLKKLYSKGKLNHQYGLIGDLNSSFKGKETISNYGYVLEYCPGHPKPHDKSTKGTRVKQHRLVIEKNYKKFDQKFFEIIGNWVVLKRQYDVHHKNNNRKDNRLENLEIITRSEHSKLHSKEHKIIRNNKNGRIIGVIKSCELLENPEEDNQQPSSTEM